MPGLGDKCCHSSLCFGRLYALLILLLCKEKSRPGPYMSVLSARLGGTSCVWQARKVRAFQKKTAAFLACYQAVPVKASAALWQQRRAVRLARIALMEATVGACASRACAPGVGMRIERW